MTLTEVKMANISRRALIQAGTTIAATGVASAYAATENGARNTPNRFVEANGIRYAYRRFGKKDGVPLILLMHFRGTMDNWDPALLDILAASRPIILFSNAGIGLSGGTTPKSIAEQAKHLEAFVGALDLKAIDLLGFSMGGFVAQQLVLDRPNLVRRLILAGTGPQGGEGMTQLSPEAAAVAFQPSTNGENLPILFFSPTPASQKAAKEFLARLGERRNDREPPAKPESMQAQIAAAIEWGTPPQSNRYARLAEIKQPVLVVNGKTDIMIPTINSYILSQNLPNAKLIIYPDSGHGALFQYHTDFGNEVIRFLSA
jgi:pimeloyl-ACP methyl ester carboxylesterase